MSEYVPITTDLRLLVGCFTTKLTDFERDKFNQLCDVLDSIHAALGAENERLREQADKQTIGDLFVRVHLDYSDMAQQFEWAAQAVRNIGGGAE